MNNFSLLQQKIHYILRKSLSSSQLFRIKHVHYKCTGDSELNTLFLFLPFFLGAAIGGHLIPWFQHAWESGIPNLVPLFAYLLGVYLWSCADKPTLQNKDAIVVIFLAIIFLFPSTQLSWVNALLLSMWLYWRSNDPVSRTALLVIAMAALQPLLVTYTLKWFANEALTLDAILLAFLLQVFTGTGSHIGNVVYGPAEHQLVILRGCSSLTNLGSAWLAWFALSRFKGIRLNRKEIVVILMLTALIVGLNLIRLYSMSIDLHWHQWWHSAKGLQTYQIASNGLLLLSILLGLRFATHHE